VVVRARVSAGQRGEERRKAGGARRRLQSPAAGWHRQSELAVHCTRCPADRACLPASHCQRESDRCVQAELSASASLPTTLLLQISTNRRLNYGRAHRRRRLYVWCGPSQSRSHLASLPTQLLQHLPIPSHRFDSSVRCEFLLSVYSWLYAGIQLAHQCVRIASPSR